MRVEYAYLSAICVDWEEFGGWVDQVGLVVVKIEYMLYILDET